MNTKCFMENLTERQFGRPGRQWVCDIRKMDLKEMGHDYVD